MVMWRWCGGWDLFFKKHQYLLPTMFRYLALFDDTINICAFRDIDNVWTEQDFYILEEWISSDKTYIIYLDENYEKQEITSLSGKNEVIRRERE